MGWGALTLAGLMVVTGQSADHLNQRAQRVPINIEPGQVRNIREMILYVSPDKGKTWQQHSVIQPDKDGFIYHAPSDGEYWLKVAVINQQGKQDPENPYQGQPDRIMVIDTMKPIIKLGTPQKQGDEVLVTWEIQEEHPDPSSLKLEYQTATSAGWVSVPIKPGPTGQARFRPGAGSVSLRMTFSDMAKNTSMAMADLGGALAPASFAQGGSSSNDQGVAPPFEPPLPTHGTSNVAGHVTPPPTMPTQGPSLRTTPPPIDSTPPVGVRPPSERVRTQPPGQAAPPIDTNHRPVASTETPPPSVPTTGSTYSSRKPLPSVQYANNRELTLEYELAKVGPSGIGSVELWWTADDGKVWERAPSPDMKDTVKGGRYTRNVELQEGDGVYGFAIVVKSRAGIGKPAPRSGDVPEMRVELDTTPPIAELYAPRADPNHRDSIMLHWVAKDKNLSPTPISLEWSERVDGPWQPIATDIANTGQYSWQIPSGIPVSVYFRLRVRDLAGNESAPVTNQPQLVDLTEPEGRLVNVTVTPRR